MTKRSSKEGNMAIETDELKDKRHTAVEDFPLFPSQQLRLTEGKYRGRTEVSIWTLSNTLSKRANGKWLCNISRCSWIVWKGSFISNTNIKVHYNPKRFGEGNMLVLLWLWSVEERVWLRPTEPRAHNPEPLCGTQRPLNQLHAALKKKDNCLFGSDFIRGLPWKQQIRGNVKTD